MRSIYVGGMAALMLLGASCGGSALHVDVPHGSDQSYEEVLNSVVALVEPTLNGLRGPTCTAFFISETDLVTAGHCVLGASISLTFGPRGPRLEYEWENANDALGRTVHFMTREQYESWISVPEASRPDNPEYYSATIISVMGPEDPDGNNDNDVAILRISNDTPRSSTHLNVRNWLNSPPEVGENAYAVGLPVGEPWVLTRGIVSRVDIARDGLVQVWHDARIGHGSSGSPLLDEWGRVVGINVQISRENVFSKATPSSIIQTLYRLHETRKEIRRLEEHLNELSK